MTLQRDASVSDINKENIINKYLYIIILTTKDENKSIIEEAYSRLCYRTS